MIRIKPITTILKYLYILRLFYYEDLPTETNLCFMKYIDNLKD